MSQTRCKKIHKHLSTQRILSLGFQSQLAFLWLQYLYGLQYIICLPQLLFYTLKGVLKSIVYTLKCVLKLCAKRKAASVFTRFFLVKLFCLVQLFQNVQKHWLTSIQAITCSFAYIVIVLVPLGLDKMREIKSVVFVWYAFFRQNSSQLCFSLSLFGLGRAS